MAGHVAPVNDEEIRFCFELNDGWRPDLEGHETFTKRANEAFKKELLAYTTRANVSFRTTKPSKDTSKIQTLSGRLRRL